MKHSLLVTAAVAVSVLLAALTIRATGDLHLEWAIGRAVLDGVSPYLPINELAGRYGIDVDYSFVVPRLPAGILFLVPVALIPQGWLMAAGVVFMVGLSYVLAVIVSRLMDTDTWRVVVWLPVFLVGSVGWELAVHGHLTVLFTIVAIGWAWLCLRRGRDLTAGVLLGLAVSLKLFPWLIVAAILPAKRRTAYAAGGVFLGANLTGLLLPNVSVGAAVRSLQTGLGFLDGHSRNGSLAAVTGLPPVVFVLLGVVAVGWMWRTYHDPGRLFGVAVPLSLLVAPLAWTLYLPVLFIPLAARGRKALMAGLLVVWMVWEALWRVAPPPDADAGPIVLASIAVVFIDELIGQHPTKPASRLSNTWQRC